VNSKDKIKEMFTLQQRLNETTNGIGWESGYTKQNRQINWYRCIYMELSELIDSFNWKHWKDINIEPNWDNIKIEVVDIWHFIMSLGLEEYKNLNRGSLDGLIDDTIETKYFYEFVNEPTLTSSEDIFIIINSIEHFIKDSLTKESYSILIDDFFEVALQCGVNIDILYELYLAKNILNEFRQAHGYKDGTYKKMWGEKEDNVVLLEILKKEMMSADRLYRELETQYKKQ
jgi:dimeric dUTPase (all-alpha-NTP-PPase superfamily)